MQGNSIVRKKKSKIYLDTSVINFLFADDAPVKKKITHDFFRTSVSRWDIELYISDVVIFEIRNTPDPRKRNELLSIQQLYQIQLVPINIEDIRVIAERYISEGIIPESKLEDAQHIAIATYYEMDFLLSWNLRHIANLTKSRKIMEINEKMKYKHTIRLCTPAEVTL